MVMEAIMSNNPYDIYKHLDKSNCKRCLLQSCMAFAVAVVQGQKKLSDCPTLPEEVIASLDGRVVKRKSLEDEQFEALAEMKTKVARLDFTDTAKRTGSKYVNGKLFINCLGKDFIINPDGSLLSDCHVIPWVHIPLLDYLMNCKGSPLTGDWVALNQLPKAADWALFFSHRCEGGLRDLMDAHPDLMFEILDLFDAGQPAGESAADRSLVLYPLPRVPMLINYWFPEDDFESQLNILFDTSIENNITIDSLYLLGRGMIEMFRQLIIRHSHDGRLF